MSQGNGPYTVEKEEGLAAGFAFCLKTSKVPSILRFPYWAVDLNGGGGWNLKANCAGSPLLFCTEAIKASRSVRAWFCDNNPELVVQLRERLSAVTLPPFIRIEEIACEDNADFLKRFGQAILDSGEDPRFSVGSVLCDPNGLRQGLPLDALADFATQFPRIDIILALNARVMLMGLGCKRLGKKGFLDWPELSEILDRLGKPYWLIRNPPRIRTAGDFFTVLIGRTKEISRSALRKYDFHPLTSTIGSEIASRLLRVATNQPSLFDGLED